MLKQYIPYRAFTWFFLFVLAAGLPLGKIFMSIAAIGLATVWLFEGNFKEKWFVNKERFHAPLIVAGAYLVHVFWLCNTSDFSFAAHDLVLKLPLLSFPIVLGTIRLSEQMIKWVLLAFVGGVLLSSLISYGIYLELFPSKKPLMSIRDISIFMSHIRFSLLICMALAITVYYAFQTKKWVIGLPVICWLAYILVLFSGTGLIILFALLIYLAYALSRESRSKYASKLVLMGCGLMIVGSIWYVQKKYTDYHQVKELVDLNNLPLASEGGEKYIHDVNDLRKENGYYIWLFIAPGEVEDTWNQLSAIPFDGMDKKGQPIKYTIYRYLTSMGVRKDNNGMNTLTAQDVNNIEEGVCTVHRLNVIDQRLNQIFFEIEEAIRGEYNDHSVTQRFLFLKIGHQILKRNLWFGVGTGDTPMAFQEEYDRINIHLSQENRLRAHNQLLTFLIAFGLIGFTLLSICWILPIVLLKGNLLFYAFILIAFMSFLSDNTLERQAGVTFFAFFYSLLLFQFNNKHKSVIRE